MTKAKAKDRIASQGFGVKDSLLERYPEVIANVYGDLLRVKREHKYGWTVEYPEVRFVEGMDGGPDAELLQFVHFLGKGDDKLGITWALTEDALKREVPIESLARMVDVAFTNKRIAQVCETEGHDFEIAEALGDGSRICKRCHVLEG